AGGPSGAWPRSWRRPACPGARASAPAGWAAHCARPGPAAAAAPPAVDTPPPPTGRPLAVRVTGRAPVEPPADGDEQHRVVLYDFGAKANIARRLRRHGARVLVVPAATLAADALAWRPDGGG